MQIQTVCNGHKCLLIVYSFYYANNAAFNADTDIQEFKW